MAEPTNNEQETAAGESKAEALKQAQAADRLIAQMMASGQGMVSQPAEPGQAATAQQTAASAPQQAQPGRGDATALSATAAATQPAASSSTAASAAQSAPTAQAPVVQAVPMPVKQQKELEAAPYKPTAQREYFDDAALKKMMKENEPSFMEKYGSCLVTFVLIAINVVVFLAEMVASGFSTSISGQTLYNMGAMFAPGISSAADLYRFVTPMFLHVDVMHLLFNMAALYSAGVLLEYLLGRWNFLLLYFIAGITGNVVSYAADIVTGSYAVSAGASTSIFGLFVAIALLGVLSKTNREYLMNYSKGMLSVIAINIVYTLLMPSVSLSGHLGGAIGGLIGMFIIPSKSLRVPAFVRVIVGVLWVVAAAAFMSASFTGFWPLSFLR